MRARKLFRIVVDDTEAATVGRHGEPEWICQQGATWNWYVASMNVSEDRTGEKRPATD